MSPGLTMVYPSTIKAPEPDMRKPFSNGVQESPKSIQAIALVFGHLPEAGGKSRLVKAPCTSDAALRGSLEAVSDLKPPR